MKTESEMAKTATADIPYTNAELLTDEDREILTGLEHAARMNGDDGFTNYVGGRRDSLRAFGGAK